VRERQDHRNFPEVPLLDQIHPTSATTTAYSVSKAALVHLTRVLDVELRAQGIADIIAFLVSDDAAPVSGAIVPAYGD
jgi:hypothetical protein